MTAKDVHNTGVQTDEKKQHFDDIYVCENPVPYKVRILDALSYVSDDFNRAMFEEHIAPFFEAAASKKDTVEYVDLCACFGNTTMACLHGMSYDEIRENWKDDDSCKAIDKPRRTLGAENGCPVTAIDISPQAMAYGQSVGLYDESFVCDLNNLEGEAFGRAKETLAKADIFLSTAALCYLSVEAIEDLVDAFCSGTSNPDGMMLVNFLNPFCLEKSDATKRILLSKLDFVAIPCIVAVRIARVNPAHARPVPV